MYDCWGKVVLYSTTVVQLFYSAKTIMSLFSHAHHYVHVFLEDPLAEVESCFKENPSA